MEGEEVMLIGVSVDYLSHCRCAGWAAGVEMRGGFCAGSAHSAGQCVAAPLFPNPGGDGIVYELKDVVSDPGRELPGEEGCLFGHNFGSIYRLDRA